MATYKEHNSVGDFVASAKALEDKMAGELRLDQFVHALVLAVGVLRGGSGVDGARAHAGGTNTAAVILVSAGCRLSRDTRV